MTNPRWLQCPEELSQAAKAFWNEHAGRLHASEDLVRHNIVDFTILCRLMALIGTAAAEIETFGVTLTTVTGTRKVNPACGVLLSAQRQAAPLLARFCL